MRLRRLRIVNGFGYDIWTATVEVVQWSTMDISRRMLKERGQAEIQIFIKAGTKQRRNKFQTSKYFKVQGSLKGLEINEWHSLIDIKNVWRGAGTLILSPVVDIEFGIPTSRKTTRIHSKLFKHIWKPFRDRSFGNFNEHRFYEYRPETCKLYPWVMHRVDLCPKAFYWTIKSQLNTHLLDLGRNGGLKPETLFRWDEPVLVAVALLDKRTR